MSNLTDLGLVEIADTEEVNDWPARANGLLNALAALRYRDSGSTATASAAMATVGVDVAGPAAARVTVTLDRQCRVKVTCLASIAQAAAAAAGAVYAIQPGYNAGAFNLAGVTKIGQVAYIGVDNQTQTRRRSGVSFANPLLAAGTYIFYPCCQRVAAGNAADVMDTFQTIVEVVSLV